MDRFAWAVLLGKLNLSEGGRDSVPQAASESEVPPDLETGRVAND
jgi:hypothetical protein